MAYFACAEAARTGTDSATRRSIAKGTVSPTFTNAAGQQVLRGIVQLDVVSGRDTGYVTGQSILERLASAGRKIVSSGGGTYVYANQAQRSVSSPSGATAAPAQLYQGDEGVIKTSTTLGLSKIQIAGIIGAIVIVGVVVMR